MENQQSHTYAGSSSLFAGPLVDLYTISFTTPTQPFINLYSTTKLRKSITFAPTHIANRSGSGPFTQ